MKKNSPLMIIFVTVFLDLIGFGMVIPLVAIYGKNFGASAGELALLGAIYSLMQFFFAPMWGSLSDRIGRRPVLLISLMGSTLAYAGFGLATSFWFLFATRALAGFFAANISAAQAYIADVTKPEDRAKGMGLIGAAFGIGFILGPPLGGISAARLSLAAPGFIAATICGLNLMMAYFRLPESLAPEVRASLPKRGLSPIDLGRLRLIARHVPLRWLLFIFFAVTFAFSNLEQTFTLLVQEKLQLPVGEAGYATGLILMWGGFLGALVQGGLIRRLLKKHSEVSLMMMGLMCSVLAYSILPWLHTYAGYYLVFIPMALGSGFINPCVSSLISKNANATEQGMVFGITQGLGSLARALGPFCGLMTFYVWNPLPFLIGAVFYAVLCFVLPRVGSGMTPTARSRIPTNVIVK